MKPLVAHQRMKEFDPECERHYFGFVVKAVDPGCTLEYQIEEADGRVTRITTTESASRDAAVLAGAVTAAMTRLLARRFNTEGGDSGEGT